MDDHCRTVFARATAERYGHSRACQLDGEFRRWNRFSELTGEEFFHDIIRMRWREIDIMELTICYCYCFIRQSALENYTFLPFSVFLAIFWIFTYKKVPETKNKTFEEILELFRHGRWVHSFYIYYFWSFDINVDRRLFSLCSQNRGLRDSRLYG